MVEKYLLIRIWELYFPVNPSGPQKGMIKNVNTIRCHQNLLEQ